MSGVLKKEKYRKAIDRKCNFRAWFRFLKGLLYPLLKLLLPGRALGLENLPESGRLYSLVQSQEHARRAYGVFGDTDILALYCQGRIL